MVSSRSFNGGSGPRRLLIVEDESIIALAESRMLKRQGYLVDLAFSGEAAIDHLERGVMPDLILMDIDLGTGMDGTETARSILERWELPIIFLTSHSSKEMVEKVQGIPRYGYLVKNMGDCVILSTIEMALDLFDKEQTIKQRNFLLRRVEENAQIGYWFIYPNERVIEFSSGSCAILGIKTLIYSFEDFERLIAAGYQEARNAAFRALIQDGIPYDVTYRIRRKDTGDLIPLRSSGRRFGDTVIGVLQDVSEIEKLLSTQRQEERRQAVLLRSIGDGVIATDTEGRVTELNSTAEDLTGWKFHEAVGRPIQEVFKIVNAKTHAPVENPVEKVLASGHVVGLANHTLLIAKDGVKRHIADSAAPILDESDEFCGMVLIFRDVTREYTEQEALRRNEETFRTIFTESHTPMLFLDPGTGRIEHANHAAQAFYGWSVQELQGMSITDINTAAPEQVFSMLKKAMRNDRTEFRFEHRQAGGGTRPVRVVVGPISGADGDRLLSLVFDASVERSLEEKIRIERERTDILLKDAHHRMKNSIQMLSSLIQLQISNIDDTKVLDALRDIQNRSLSIALVYEQLYWSEDQDTVSSKEYLASLLHSIEDSYVRPPIGLSGTLIDRPLPGRFAILLGLIVSELILNAVKYAFPAGRAGKITVEFSNFEGDGLRLLVRDDGVGFGDSNRGDVEKGHDGVGLTLVRSLVAQEKGSVELHTDSKGTSVCCRFPSPPNRGNSPPDLSSTV